ncbi:MAG: hypothetical protein JEZ06_16715 [Anaerolineaceae bacterium]|nr:hypothetical protein [Anaerolineaceae bacterium]
MTYLQPIKPIDYLIIGHLTHDIVPGGFMLGGTAAYAALTAKAMGFEVGIVSSCANCHRYPELSGIQIIASTAEFSTTFENINHDNERLQYIHHKADDLDLHMIPELWKTTPIVHFGPVAQEISPNLVHAFPDSMIGLTPQGWMRQWDNEGKVTYTDWIESIYVLPKSSAAIISLDDVKRNEEIIEDMVPSIPVLVVTDAGNEIRVYWHGDIRCFKPAIVEDVDATGAGDIFAATFFGRLYQTRNPWEAARFANGIASQSISRLGLNSAPTPTEIKKQMIEVISNN